MTPDERERLAQLIAQELLRVSARDEGSRPEGWSRPWLPPPVRPQPPARGQEAPPWAAAAQSLGDVAPIRTPAPSVHRDAIGPAAAAVRAAAAGAGPPRGRATGGPTGPESAGKTRAGASRRTILGVELPVGISRRHVHLSEADAELLFGTSSLEVERPILQPGQFAARQRVTLQGPRGQIEAVRVVGPPRGQTQLEIARSDATRLGITAPVAASGALEHSAGGVTLIGPAGRLMLDRGVIVAARHVHLSPEDATRWGVRDGDRLDIRCGTGARAVTWHEVLVRSGPSHATEFHLDEDEAHACAVEGGATVRVVGRRDPRGERRTLVTERVLTALVRAGAPLPPGAIYTPSARDRARAFGVDLP